MWWRVWLRQEGPWGYEQAAAFRGWSDKAIPLGSKAKEALEMEARMDITRSAVVIEGADITG
jgi:hypothetical protein